MKRAGFFLLLAAFLFSYACTSGTSSPRTAAKTKAEKARMATEAVQSEKEARKSHGKAAAENWYRAGKLWVHPDNPKKSYERALACFYRVNRKEASAEVAEDARIWISVLTQLLHTKETADSLKDAVEGSERLQKREE